MIRCFFFLSDDLLRTHVLTHTTLDPHEMIQHNLVVAAFPLHTVDFRPLRITAAAALTRGAVLGPVLLYTRAAVVLESDWLNLSPRVLAVLAFLEKK